MKAYHKEGVPGEVRVELKLRNGHELNWIGDERGSGMEGSSNENKSSRGPPTTQRRADGTAHGHPGRRGWVKLDSPCPDSQALSL